MDFNEKQILVEKYLNSDLQFSNNKETKKKKKEEEEDLSIVSISDSVTSLDSSSIFTPTQENFMNTVSPPYSPKETIQKSTLSIPVPQSNRISTSQKSPIAELSQIQYQLQMDHQNSSPNKTTHDRDEILIKLNINTINPHSILNNLEIIAKGYVQVKTEQQLPSPINSPSLCCPPRLPIGPPIQPIFNLSRIAIPNKYDPGKRHSFVNSSKCDYLCQSSLNQPDFRGRPAPGMTTNPYFS